MFQDAIDKLDTQRAAVSDGDLLKIATCKILCERYTQMQSRLNIS